MRQISLVIWKGRCFGTREGGVERVASGYQDADNGGVFFWHTAVVGLCASDSSEVAVVFVIVMETSSSFQLGQKKLEGTCVDVAMDPVVLDNVNASTLVPTAVDDDNALPRGAAVTDMDVLVSPAVLKDVAFKPSEVAVVFLINEEDKLLDSATAEVLESIGVDDPASHQHTRSGITQRLELLNELVQSTSFTLTIDAVHYPQGHAGLRQGVFLTQSAATPFLLDKIDTIPVYGMMRRGILDNLIHRNRTDRPEGASRTLGVPTEGTARDETVSPPDV